MIHQIYRAITNTNKLLACSIFFTLCLLAPIAVGLAGTILPAFHYLPALGSYHFDLTPWEKLFSSPELLGSIKLTLVSGLLATLISFFLAFTAVAILYQSRFFASIKHALSPILAIPHAAIAIGLVFLLSPSGWIVRLISPWLTSYERPPTWVSVQDPYGLSLVVALIVKETPFLLFVIFSLFASVKAGGFDSSW